MNYGLPELKKYPLNGLENLQKCVKYFVHCPENLKEELANNIYQASLKEGYELDGNEDMFRYVNFNEEVIDESCVASLAVPDSKAFEDNKYIEYNELEDFEKELYKSKGVIFEESLNNLTYRTRDTSDNISFFCKERH